MLSSIIILCDLVLTIDSQEISQRNASIEHQNLELSPPFPIMEIGLQYILGQIGDNATEAVTQSIQNFLPTNPDAGLPQTSIPVSISQPLNKVIGPIECSSTLACLE